MSARLEIVQLFICMAVRRFNGRVNLEGFTPIRNYSEMSSLLFKKMMQAAIGVIMVVGEAIVCGGGDDVYSCCYTRGMTAPNTRQTQCTSLQSTLACLLCLRRLGHTYTQTQV